MSTDADLVPTPVTDRPEAGFDAAISATAQDQVTHRWSRATRIGFRFAFCYFMTYCLCSGNATLWEAIPYGAAMYPTGCQHLFLCQASISRNI